MFDANELSSTSYIYTPTVRTRNTEFWDVGTSGVTDLKIKSGATTFMTFNITNGIDINKPIIMNNNSITGMSNIYTKQEIDNLLSNKAGTSELSTKQNVLTS